MRALRADALLALLLTAAAAAAVPTPAAAQQKIGYVDTEYILDQLPEYATVQQRIDRLTQQWEQEVEQQHAEVEELVEEFRARKLLYTDEERQSQQKKIEQARQEVKDLRQRYFGPKGELYRRQKELMRPIQERVLEAVETVARGEGYDYVFDKSGQMLLMYAEQEYDLSSTVLEELGIDVDRTDSESE